MGSPRKTGAPTARTRKPPRRAAEPSTPRTPRTPRAPSTPPASRAARARRRIGAEDSETRARLLDAAERLVLESGYASVSSRRVAARARLKPQLVHYYFRTMDDLFLAVYRRRAEKSLERHERALASDEPLRALWELGTDPRGTVFTLEFAALANHRKTIRAEIAQHAERFRRMQVDAIERLLARRGLSAEAFPPLAVVLALTGVSQVLVLEQALGTTLGHAETVALVERYLRELEGAAAPRARTKPS